MSETSRVFQAVLKYGVASWYSIALRAGLTGPEIDACTYDKPTPISKLDAIIDLLKRECGVEEAEESLLAACENIPQPIIGAVREFLRQGAQSSAKGSVQATNPCGRNWDYHFFICHEGQSKSFARRIFRSLEQSHIRAFLDENCIDPTQNICPALSAAIKNSRFVMVILTQEFISKVHPTREFHLARERHKAEMYSTNLGVVFPIFYKISPDTLAQYLDINTSTDMAGCNRRPDQSDDDFLSEVIRCCTHLVDKVKTQREVLTSGDVELQELIRRAGLPQEWIPPR